MLESLFDVSVSYQPLPGMYRDLNQEQIPDDYVEQLEAFLHRKLVDFPGMLFLVGAGLFGKLYCAEIKRQGGIALDLGSLLDAWAGVGSRSTVYKSMFSGYPRTQGVPDLLRLNEENIQRLMATHSTVQPPVRQDTST